jgi:polyisoprenoid-binding protein YceI
MNMKIVLVSLIISFSLVTIASGQKYYSKTGHIEFLSEAPIETIKSTNDNGYVVLDAATGYFEFSVLIKGFKFQKALMQQHFNESYLESDQFPKAVSKGTILNIATVKLNVDKTYDANISGQITIHGVTKPFKCVAKLTVKDKTISAFTTFDLVIADYGIEIPSVVRDNISDRVKVSVSADLLPMNQ